MRWNHISTKKVKEISESLINEINLNLFNKEPTIHKCYQVYFELLQYGYAEEDKEFACELIRKYFMKRTQKKHNYEFEKIFGIKFEPEMMRFLTLSYRSSIINDEEIDEISHKISILIEPLELSCLGINKSFLSAVLREIYSPAYFENEWNISVSILNSKIKKEFIKRGIRDNYEIFESLFSQIDHSTSSKLKNSSFNFISKEELSFNKTVVPGKIIKDSELNFIKINLELLNSNEFPENLNDELYFNENRHSLVSIFIDLSKQFNKIMRNHDWKNKEGLSSLHATIRALQETGDTILRLYNANLEKEESLSVKMKQIN